MALFDFLKRKKEVEKALRRSAPRDKPEKKPERDLVVKEAKKVKEEKPTKSKKVKGFSYQVIKEPHISEKATVLGEQSKYIFKIYENVNKQEIKKSIEGIHGVDVLAVNTIKIPPKKIRIGRTEGFKKGYSKAIVTLKEGQRIELF